ncbi:MAG: hypothetical protein J6X92_02725 [Bacteroidales bacterium]|nr:hypothetical protein [Bacteroidales bacterium]
MTSTPTAMSISPVSSKVPSPMWIVSPADLILDAAYATVRNGSLLAPVVPDVLCPLLPT